VQRGFQLGDLDFSHGEAPLDGLLLHPPCEERFARAVFAADGLEDRCAAGHLVQFLPDHRGQAIESDGELVEAFGGHSALA